MRKTIIIFLILQLFSVSWINAVAQKNKPLVLHSDKQRILSDGKTICTTQLQQAIDRISKRGGGTLVLTPGTYLSCSIFLKSGVTLKLEKGAGLLGSPNPYQYMKADVDANGRDARHDNASMALVVAQKCTKFFYSY
jgi:polygalacturonase